MDQAKNFAKGTVDDLYDDLATSIDLVAADGLNFPTPPFNAVWWNVTDFPDPADDPNVEVIRVTAISTDTLTITRAQEGTTARDHNEGGKTFQLSAGLTAKVINSDVSARASATEGQVLIADSVGNPQGARASDDGSVFDISPDSQTGARLDGNNGLITLGDVLNNVNNTKVEIDDANQQFRVNKQPIFTGLPSSDPAIAGALYYDAGTGVVKRSAG
jgi:hypothetical protein